MAATGIYGLSGSGLDIESLVKMGMMSKQSQYNKMQQQETLNIWKKEEWSEIYNKMNTYNMSTLSTYKLQSNMSAMQAVSSNSGVVSATANGAAASMTHQVSVTQMASNAYMMTGDGWTITRESGNKISSNLSDVIFKSYKSLGDDQYEVSFADGTKKTVKSTDTAISMDIADSVKSDGTYNTNKLTYTYADLFDSKKTLHDLAADVSKSGANIQGGYDAANDTFSLYNKDGGSNNIIGLTASNKDTETLLNNLHLAALDKATNSLGKYDSAGNFTSGVDASGKGQVYTFKSEDSMPTKLETTSIVRSDTSPSSLKDVLGLSATLTKGSDGSYTMNVQDYDGTSLGTFTGTDFADLQSKLAGSSAFKLNLNDGTNTAEVGFSYADIFDVAEMSSAGGKRLNSKASLSDLADKINNASYVDANGDPATAGIIAKYDEQEDSFSVRNMSGKANITAVSTDIVGNRMLENLNLQQSDEINAIGVKDKRELMSLLGLSAKYTDARIDTNHHSGTLSITDGKNIDNLTETLTATTGKDAFIGSNSKYATTEFMTLTVGDGKNSVDVNLTYGDIFDFSKFADYSSSTPVIKYNGVKVDKSSVNVNIPAKNDLGSIADKINAAAQQAGLNVTADYSADTGEFSLINYNGAVSLTSSASNGSNLQVSIPVSSISLDGVDAKKSNGIKRMNAVSTDDRLKDILGISAISDGDGYKVTDSSGKSSDVKGTDIAFSLQVGDTNNKKDITFTYDDIFSKGMSMDDLAKKIDSAGTAVRASYDSATGGFTMSNGSGHATVAGTDDLGKLLVKNLGMKESSDTSSLKTGVVKGTDAEVTIDGKHYTLDKNSQTVAGVTYTFNGVTEPGKTANVTVSQDTDKIVDYVKQFVEDYNNLLDYFNDKLSEQRYSDYKPLSSKQEEQMTETQVNKWNEKAKSGLLYHDTTLQGIVNNMRDALFAPVVAADGKYNSAGAIGISSVTIKGHIVLDEDKLRKALAEEPNSVYQIFASDQDSSYVAGSTNKKSITSAQKRLDYANTGIANRLTNVMKEGLITVSDHAGTSKDVNDQSYLGKLITNLQTKMSTFKTQMNAYESMLYKRYDAMEVALQSFGTQLNYITGYGN